jgi:hypothetical protein
MSSVSRSACGRAYAFVGVLAASVVLGSSAALGYSPPLDQDQQPRSARKAADRGGSKASHARPARSVKRAAETPPERPLFAIVSIADQRVSIYNHRGLVERSPISTGVAGHPTPKGIFSIIGRERFHRSNLYSGAPMPFMQRITWSGIAMHLGVVPGYPASHGCIRLPAAFAERLWGLTRIGERVVISQNDIAPTEFAHPLLPAPKMRVLAEAAAAEPPRESDAGQATPVAAQPAPLNPRQYAVQLKAKAAAEAAAAAKALKEASAAIGPKRQEAARAAAELETAEAAHAALRAKAEAAVKAYDAAVAAVGAKRQEQESAVAAEPKNDAPIDEAAASRAADALAEAEAAREAAAAAKASAEAELADAAAKLDEAKAASAAKSAELDQVLRRSSEAASAAEAAAKAEKEAQLRLSPLSLMVSKKDKRIYVRQGLTPLFDAPVDVRDPEIPLGSHLFIATAAESDGASLKWTVVSMPVRAEEPYERKRRTASIDERIGAPAASRSYPSSPAEALERIEIADDVRERIAERLWTGGSLIISDQSPSSETGAVGTDLTVKLR